MYAYTIVMFVYYFGITASDIGVRGQPALFPTIHTPAGVWDRAGFDRVLVD